MNALLAAAIIATMPAPAYDLVATVEIEGETFAFTEDSGLTLEDCAPREGFRHAVIRAWPGTIINGPVRFTCEKDETR